MGLKLRLSHWGCWRTGWWGEIWWFIILVMEAASTSETSVNFYTSQQSKRRPSSYSPLSEPETSQIRCCRRFWSHSSRARIVIHLDKQNSRHWTLLVFGPLQDRPTSKGLFFYYIKEFVFSTMELWVEFIVSGYFLSLFLCRVPLTLWRVRKVLSGCGSLRCRASDTALYYCTPNCCNRGHSRLLL
jgi:hypothetical protein